MPVSETKRPIWQRKRLPYSLNNLVPLLVRAEEISKDQAQSAFNLAQKERVSKDSGDGLDFLLKLKLERYQASQKNGPTQLTEEVILQALGSYFGLAYKQVDYLELDLEVSTKTISESFAKQHQLVPLRIRNSVMELLVFNPFQPELWQDMERVVGIPYTVFLGTRSEIQRLIDDFFQFRLAIQAAESEFGQTSNLGNLESRVQVSEKQDSKSHKHIINAVDYLLRSALRERASDIHIEPKRSESSVRFRIDGVLHTLYRLPMTVHQAMLTRIKTLGRMDIAEKRRPQDGRIQLVLDQTPTDVRISTIPVAFGEKIVLRLLSSETTLKKTNQLGMDQEQFQIFNSFLKNTYGLILVTGPTGSGKSTTLYSTMKTMASPKVNIVTVEEPIEMVVDDFNQIGVQTKIGVTFSSILRNILRQDPDIIMIGEIRDLETAQQAIQAALTGHIVFSTLHTNDAASALTRLIDLGLEPYLINASLIGIIAQRLVRVICPFCKTSYPFPQDYLQNLGVQRFFAQFSDPVPLYHGSGCKACRETGFYDRNGIFEIMHYNNELKQALKSGQDVNRIRELLRKNNVPSLLEAGMNKVKQGITTIDEVLRVTGGLES